NAHSKHTHTQSRSPTTTSSPPFANIHPFSPTFWPPEHLHAAASASTCTCTTTTASHLAAGFLLVGAFQLAVVRFLSLSSPFSAHHQHPATAIATAQNQSAVEHLHHHPPPATTRSKVTEVDGGWQAGRGRLLRREARLLSGTRSSSPAGQLVFSGGTTRILRRDEVVFSCGTRSSSPAG
ncbi:isoleucine--tRNA ligase, partial [Striga asiatica]